MEKSKLQYEVRDNIGTIATFMFREDALKYAKITTDLACILKVFDSKTDSEIKDEQSYPFEKK